MRKSTVLFRVVALILVLSCVVPTTAMAAAVEPIEPKASLYLTSYNAYVCPVGGGNLQLWFSVTGTGYLDEIGCLRIMIYESTDNVNFTWKRTYLHEDYTAMLDHNDYYHSTYLVYPGVVGRYYKCYVCIWGGKNGQGDTRYIWTSPRQAT